MDLGRSDLSLARIASLARWLANMLETSDWHGF